MKRHTEHGSALIVAVVVVIVISVLAIGLIRLAALETAGAVSGAKRQQLVQCAEAGAHLLLSKFHLLGQQAPTTITALNVKLDGPLGQSRVVGGHIDGDFVNVQLDQVVSLPQRAAGEVALTWLTNTTRAGVSMEKRPLKVTVHCQDGGTAADPTSGRQLEVELGVRWGI
jgi:type II secretory pathway pseudopilin PulG